MHWRQIFIRKDILTTGLILAETPVSFQIHLTPRNPGPLQNVTQALPVFIPTNIPQLLTLPTPLQELPHNTPNENRTIVDVLRQRLSQSQVLVLHLGEPITAFHGANLVELPTPLLGTKRIDINYFSPYQAALSGMLIAYGRRLFLAVRPLQGYHPDMFILCSGRISRIPLPTVFDTALHPEFVENHRLTSRYLDPAIVLGISTRLMDPIVESLEPMWNGFLQIEEQNGGLLLIRASGIRISFPRQPLIRGIEQLPRQICFKKSGVISSTECIEKISLPHAEWLGLFVLKDEMGVTPRHEGLEAIYANMLRGRFVYFYKLQRGILYMWSMHIGELQRGKYTFVFVIVPDCGASIHRMSITRPRTVEWKGILSVPGLNIPAVAARWVVPRRRAMVEFNWGERLNFLTSCNVRSIMRNLVRFGRWAVRFSVDGSDFVKDIALLTIGFALMENGKAYRMRLGEGGEMGDLIMFAINQEGLGVCLIGVTVGYGELGI